MRQKTKIEQAILLTKGECRNIGCEQCYFHEQCAHLLDTIKSKKISDYIIKFYKDLEDIGTQYIRKYKLDTIKDE